jgi:hypothetical protein
MIVDDSKKSLKISKEFYCNNCDYSTCKRSDYTKHLSTDKHKNNENDSKMVVNDSEKSPNVAQYTCECGKIYKYDSGYYRHKKICQLSQTKSHDLSDKNLILMLINQNKELMEIVKNGTNNVIYNNNNHNNVNSHNKTFNLQVFLNETCKDAMNISDFIESVQLQVSDLENVGKVGYIEGISNIIIKNLNALEVEKRPVHCTDKKREVMYVKEDNVWEKEDEANKKLRKAIRKIAHKNICMFKAYREKYPDCEEYDSKKNSQYNTIIYESMGGKGDNDYEKDTKIIKKIAKVVGIEKN